MIDMELVQDLVWTASVALILSFFVAKLVAMAMTDRESESESDFKVSGSVGEGVVMGERLKVEEVFQSQRRVEFIGQVEEVDRFGGTPVHPVEQVVEPLQHTQECSDAKEGEESAAVEFPKQSGDDEKVSVEKARDFDRQRGHEAQKNSENKAVEENGAESVGNDVVTAQSEDCIEAKGKREAIVVTSDNYSDEDDWEGIEKSELDDGYGAAVKSEGG